MGQLALQTLVCFAFCLFRHPQHGNLPHVMHTVALACHAMATRFELVLQGHDPVALRAAGEEAIREIEHLEAQLSIYRPNSELSQINARAADEAVRVEPRLFSLLQLASHLSAETGGTFDITIAPLMRCWGLMQKEGRIPTPEELAEARANIGWQHLELDAKSFTVRFASPGLMLDLGSIGKGYALEQAADILREAGVTSALLHGGTSTIYALGKPLDAPAWSIALANPQQEGARWISSASAQTRQRFAPIATVDLCDEALSVSAVWGKSFEANGRVYGHVIDPRLGEPTTGALMAACVLPSATESDALSTALLVGGEKDWPKLAALRSPMRCLVVNQPVGDELPSILMQGIAPQ
jgi:thiamine biosynthesis lipoprotein